MADSPEETRTKEPIPYSLLVDRLSLLYPGLELACMIDEGWSSDDKLKLRGTDGVAFLLRCSRDVTVSRRSAQADAMLRASAAGMRCTTSIKYGELEGGGSFMLQTWLEGECLNGIIAGSSPSSCYDLGRLAGHALRSVHSATMTAGTEHAFIKATMRIERHLEGYLRSGFREPWEKDALTVIRRDITLLGNRPICLRHGDYHPGNMVLTPEGGLGIIDFDRCDTGDPFDEFYKAEFFSRQMSPDFVIGQLHEYFEGDPPPVFWKVLKLYLADVTLHSLVWAMPFGESEVEGMRARARMVLSDFDGFRSQEPSWYRKA